MTTRVTVWSENWHERHQPEIAAVYPDGIHGAVAAGIAADERFSVRTGPRTSPARVSPTASWTRPTSSSGGVTRGRRTSMIDARLPSAIG